jgi:hypothetical protein
MSKHTEHSPATDAVAVPHPPQQTALLPKPLYAAFLLAIVIGVAIFASRNARLISGTLADLNDAGATTVKGYKKENNQDKEVDINNGLLDEYGSVSVKNNSETVGSFLSLCDINPPAALQIFRKSMDDGNKSARLIALYSTFFLVPKCALDKEDLQRIIVRLDPDKENDADVRRVAQKTLSDLVLIKNVAGKTTYEALPPDIKSSSDEWPSNNVVVREEKTADGSQLRVRWSNPNTAFAWWKQHGEKGHWSPERNAWEIP